VRLRLLRPGAHHPAALRAAALHAAARFDEAGFVAAVRLQVRFLDNVLDATPWPLPEQQEQALAKRRIGVGFTGLGNALAMLNLRYDSEAGRRRAAHIATLMRDAAYAPRSSWPSSAARSPRSGRGLSGAGSFASRLPEALKARIRQHGIRNSHLLSIAPTGTVSLAFADNASNGIEPPSRWPTRATSAAPTAAPGLRGGRPRPAGVPRHAGAGPGGRSARRGVPLPGRVHARASACA
jgi:hypothetical protein